MSRRSLPGGRTTCLHCEGDCRLTNGVEIFPPRSDLHHKHFYVCDQCEARVGCHPDTTTPLGYAADEPTRKARSMLHELMLDPLWNSAPNPKRARRWTYKFLANALGIKRDHCHTGMFTIERCREAWKALRYQTPATIQQWNDARRIAAQEAETDRKRKKHGQPRRRASRDYAPSITGRSSVLNKPPSTRCHGDA